MVNIKKIDAQDLVFVNKTLTAKEELAFSLFLKAKKAKTKVLSKSAKRTRGKHLIA
jgi:hypothetical protein